MTAELPLRFGDIIGEMQLPNLREALARAVQQSILAVQGLKKKRYQ